MDNPTNSKFDFIKYLPIGSTFVLGLLYFLGLIVNLIYFAQYGISTISLLKLQYILAGFWALFPILIVLFVFSWLFHTHTSKDYTKTGSYFISMLVPIALLLGLFYYTYSIYHPSYIVYSETKNGIYYMNFIGTLISSIIFIPIYIISFYGTFKKYNIHQNIKLLSLYVIAGFILFIGYLGAFSYTLYENIPIGYGGGKPETVQFIIKDEKDKTSLPIELASSSNKSISYKLLLETDKTYVILPNNNQVKSIELSRDLFAGIIYLSEQKK